MELSSEARDRCGLRRVNRLWALGLAWGVIHRLRRLGTSHRRPRTSHSPAFLTRTKRPGEIMVTEELRFRHRFERCRPIFRTKLDTSLPWKRDCFKLAGRVTLECQWH